MISPSLTLMFSALFMNSIWATWQRSSAAGRKKPRRVWHWATPPIPSTRLQPKNSTGNPQGIYYTPKFVTDYIVKGTVGRYLKDHTFNENRHVKILDPSCGSGSFLIRAFDELLEYHAKEGGKSITDMEQYERLRILSANIHGVDLDRQAVEICRLNLLLRSLKNRQQLEMLKDNIKQGNSLISGVDEELKEYFGDGWRAKHPFNWDGEFADIMGKGGFDVVIGNPPYVGSLDLSKSTGDKTKEFFRTKYKSATGVFDLYVLFLEKAIALAKNKGVVSLIVPNKFLVNDYGIGIRNILLNYKIIEILDISNLEVFNGTAVYPVILTVQKEPPGNDNVVKIGRVGTETGEIDYTVSSQEEWINTEHKVMSLGRSSEASILLGKIAGVSRKLKEIARVFSGTTGFDYTSYGKLLSDKMTSGLIKFVVSGNIEPYCINWGKKIHYSKRTFNGAYFDVESLTVSEGRKHLYKTKNKLLIRGMSKRLIAGLDSEGLALAVGVYAVVDTEYDTRYILALLNSKVTDYYFKAKYESKHLAGGYIAYNAGQLEQIPIRQIDLTNPIEKAVHDRIVALVERMLDLNKILVPVRDVCSQERDGLMAEIEKTDKEIDSLVYKLYDLTEEEITVVEGAGASSGVNKE